MGTVSSHRKRATHPWEVVVALVVLLVALPLMVRAEDATPEMSEAEVQQQDATQAPQPTPTSTPEPTPTSAPEPIPTLEPTPTPVPPTAEEMQERASSESEQMQERAAGTDETATAGATETATSAPESTSTPEPTVTPTQEPPPNTDRLTSVSSTGPVRLEPGEEHQLAFTYVVTTPRTGTDIRAELRYADGSLATAWWLTGQAGRDAEVSGGGAIDLTETVTLTQGSSFPLVFVVTAPAEVTEAHSVSLYVSSTATTADGNVETGVREGRPIATLTAEPLPPAEPLPNTDSLLAISARDPVTLEPGQEQLYEFSYLVTTERVRTDVHAELRAEDGSLADGWVLRAQTSQDGWVGDSASIDIAETRTLISGTAFSLTFAVVAPADVPEEQIVSLHARSTVTTATGEVESGIEDGAPLTSLTVTSLPMLSARTADVSLQSVVSGEGYCTQLSPVGTDAVAVGEYLFFQCRNINLTTLVSANSDKPFVLHVTSVSDGWQWAFVYGTSEIPTGSPTEWLTPANIGGQGNSGGQNDHAYIYLRPASETAGPGVLSLEMNQVSRAAQGTPYPANLGGPRTATLGASLAGTTPSACDPSISANGDSLGFAPSVWSGTDYPTVSGDLDLAITAPGEECSGTSESWSIQVSATTMTSSSGNTIQPDFISYAGWSASGNPPIGVMPETNSAELAGTTQIATGNSGFTASATWTAGFTLDPPADQASGVYSGTITVTVGNTQQTFPVQAIVSIPGHECEQSPESDIVGTDSFVRFTCTTLDNGQFHRYVTFLTEGWEYRLSIDGTEPSGDFTSEIPSTLPIDTSNSINFIVDLRPTVAVAPGTPAQVTVAVMKKNDPDSTEIITLGAWTPPPCTPTVSASGTPLDFGTSTWTGSAYPPIDQNIQLSISTSGSDCSGFPANWGIGVSASDMTGSHGGTIAASDIHYAGTTPETTVPDGFEPGGVSLPLATTGSPPATTIASGDFTVSPGFVWDVTFQLQPPNHAPPGEYNGTITITVAQSGD